MVNMSVFLNSEDILEKNAAYEMVKCLNKKCVQWCIVMTIP